MVGHHTVAGSFICWLYDHGVHVGTLCSVLVTSQGHSPLRECFFMELKNYIPAYENMASVGETGEPGGFGLNVQTVGDIHRDGLIDRKGKESGASRVVGTVVIGGLDVGKPF